MAWTPAATCPSAPTSCASPSRERAVAASTAGAARRPPSARSPRSSACSASRPRSRAARTSPASRWSCGSLADAAVVHAARSCASGRSPTASERNDEMVGLAEGRAGADRLDRQALGAGRRSPSSRATGRAGSTPRGSTADDGRVGFAPFVLRAVTPSERASLVVLPTNTWQAYNLYDRDGDGWGDTWYAGGRPAVVLDRPYRDRGVPPRFRRYDRRRSCACSTQTGVTPDFLADDDLDAVATGDELRALYDLVVFPGHTRVRHDARVRRRRAVPRPRRPADLPLGEQLLLAGRAGRATSIRRIAQWRDARAARGAAARGPVPRERRRARARRRSSSPTAEAAPWLFEGTGLENGDLLGEDGRRLRDRDRHDDPDLAARHDRARAHHPDLFGPGSTRR